LPALFVGAGEVVGRDEGVPEVDGDGDRAGEVADPGGPPAVPGACCPGPLLLAGL